MKFNKAFDIIPSDSLTGMRLSRCSYTNEYNSNIITLEDITTHDLELISKLIRRGSSHRKFLRMWNIYVDIKASMVWWKQMDTYKFVTNLSDSTMYNLHMRKLTPDDFEDIPDFYLEWLNGLIEDYNYTNDRSIMMKLYDVLPCGYLSRRIINFNYETMINIYNQRIHHKLGYWKYFIESLTNSIKGVRFVLDNLK